MEGRAAGNNSSGTDRARRKATPEAVLPPLATRRDGGVVGRGRSVGAKVESAATATATADASVEGGGGGPLPSNAAVT